MNENYLPRSATISQSCEWLQNETGKPWTLSRLLEHGLMPWFWLDYRADADAVFAGRKQGYLAPLCFAGDAGRLANGSREVRVTMTRNHAGEVISLPPGSLVLPLDDVRFRRDDLTQLASKFSDAPAAKGGAGTGTSTGGAAIPGKMPSVTIGKLAIKAAWQIEGDTGKRATAKQVIEKLQSWVDHKDNTEAVAELIDKIPNGVKWVTSAGKENSYDIGACQKTLETWKKSRA